jgi:DNA-binding beta-propeller fold protein YncE
MPVFTRTLQVGLLLVVITGAGAAIPAIHAQSSLRPVAAIPLPNVSGRIDHLAFDATRQRLFVAALGNDTLEVLDTAKGVHLRSVAGFHEPQGLAVISDLNAVAVANGGTGTLQLVDAETLQTRWTVHVGGDADNVRYDAAAKRVYVAAEGGLFAFDAASGRAVQRIPFAGHPESFQLEVKGPRVFANLPGATQIVVGDRGTMAVLARWPTHGCGRNYPMALDESAGRVFIGCRSPASLSEIDAASGKVVASVPTVGDTDDLFYDTARGRLYVIGGEGFVDVVERNGDTLRRTSQVPTRDGARTGLWVADQNRLYVAAPARGGRPAEVRVFEPQN